MSDSEAQDSLECTLRTETQRNTGERDSDSVSSRSGSECPSSLEESDDPTPLRYQKRCLINAAKVKLLLDTKLVSVEIM